MRGIACGIGGGVGELASGSGALKPPRHAERGGDSCPEAAPPQRPQQPFRSASQHGRIETLAMNSRVDRLFSTRPARVATAKRSGGGGSNMPAAGVRKCAVQFALCRRRQIWADKPLVGRPTARRACGHVGCCLTAHAASRVTLTKPAPATARLLRAPPMAPRAPGQRDAPPPPEPAPSPPFGRPWLPERFRPRCVGRRTGFETCQLTIQSAPFSEGAAATGAMASAGERACGLPCGPAMAHRARCCHGAVRFSRHKQAWSP